MTHNPGISPDGQLFLPDYTLWKSFNIHTGSGPNVLPLLDLSSAQSSRELVLTWTGKLETANSPVGPWTTVPEVSSPLVLEPSEPRRYYRARLP